MTDQPNADPGAHHEELIDQALQQGLGAEDVKTWEQGAPERDAAEARLVERLHSWHARLEKLEAGLAENSAATARIEKNTASIVEAFESWRGALRVLEGIGKFARPLGYIAMAGSAFVGLFYAVKGGAPGGKP